MAVFLWQFDVLLYSVSVIVEFDLVSELVGRFSSAVAVTLRLRAGLLKFAFIDCKLHICSDE